MSPDKRERARQVSRKSKVAQRMHGDRHGKPLPASALIGTSPAKRRTRAEMLAEGKERTREDEDEDAKTVKKPVTLPGGYQWRGSGLLVKQETET